MTKTRSDCDMSGGGPPCRWPRCFRSRSRSGRGAGRLAVALAELEVQLEDVAHRDTEQPAARRERLLLDQRLDVAAHLALITLRVLRPRGGDAVELELRVVERDVRVESGARRHDEIGRYVLEGGVR